MELALENELISVQAHDESMELLTEEKLPDFTWRFNVSAPRDAAELGGGETLHEGRWFVVVRAPL